MKRELLSCEKARAICILKTMARAGHFPSTESEKEAWFVSPFRTETKASFKVSKIKNLWFDHGAGFGGNVLDLVVRLYDCRVSDALDFLSDIPPSLSFHPQPFVPPSNNGLVVKSVNPIWHFGLKDYIKERNITLETAKNIVRKSIILVKGTTTSVLAYKTIPVAGNFGTNTTSVHLPQRILHFYTTEFKNWS